MKSIVTYLLCIVTLLQCIFSKAEVSRAKKGNSAHAQILLETIDETLKSENLNTLDGNIHEQQPISYEYSQFLHVCHTIENTPLYQRAACCTPNDVRHLYNVLIQDGKLVVFVPSDRMNQKFPPLPPVTSVKMQNQINFNLPIEYREGPLDRTKHCTRYYNGTLHVVGRSTVHNIYHSLGDNVMPLLSQIILDAYLSRDMLYSPRSILTHFQQRGKDPLKSKPDKKGKDAEFVAPHLRLMVDAMSDGTLSLQQASGVCFRRVVWGHGPHIFYVDTLQELRRLTSKFARIFAQKLLAEYVKRGNYIRNLWDYAPPTGTDKSLVRMDNQPLKVVLYTRGNSGKGRTIQNEDKLVNALREKGAKAFICCDFQNTTLEEQLYYATQADVIMGLHGAALTHGIFMAPGTISLELKTLYGHDSILFGLVADSRVGLHAQVNIRSYFVPGGQKPIDDSLVKRTLAVLQRALMMQKTLGVITKSGIYNRTECSFDKLIAPQPNFKTDLVFGPSCSTPLASHILGPNQKGHEEICRSMYFNRMREVFGIKDRSFHCDICTKYVV